MFLENISRPDQQEIINQLEQALYNYRQWHSSLIRTLLCKLPPDKHDVMPYAHKECRFGQWYYNYTLDALTSHPGFIALGEAHELMHQLATHLLLADHIEATEYDLFSNTVERVQLEILTLKREIEDSLYNHDSLTGAISRVNMLPILREQQELVNRKQQACCIVMIDIDHFKRINDQYGHQMGDQVLNATSAYLMKNIRPYDKLFRYGGEEFILCMPQTELQAGLEIVERLRAGLSDSQLLAHKKLAVPITASFGLALLDAKVLAEEAIERADQAMYAAKAAGRNRVHVWKADMKKT